jgi:hypothetical protein
MKWIAVTILVLLVAAPSLAQEQGTWEFGFDAGLGAEFYSDVRSLGASGDLTVLRADLPGSSWRFGYFMTPFLSIEVPLRLSYSNHSGAVYFTEWDYSIGTGLGLIYNAPSGSFIGIRGLFAMSDVEPSDRTTYDLPRITQYGIGGTLGLRRQVFADNIRLRVSVDYSYLSEYEPEDYSIGYTPASNTLAFMFGLSVLL